jgi:acetyltransferase-like isoleucine patch superfamily enzyme
VDTVIDAKKTTPITGGAIGADCWIAAEPFIAPGVCVEDGVVPAARACAFERLEAWKIYRGNPAVLVRGCPWRRTSREARAEMQPLERGRG